MAQWSSARSYAPDEVLEITRMFDAPRELVFQLWSRPDYIVRWWGPEGMGLSHCEMDFCVGGAWRFCMHGPGADHWISGVYREVRAPERLSFSYIGDVAQHDTLVEIDFIARGERTEMRFRQAPFPTVADRDDHNWGWSSTFDLLAGYLRDVAAAGDPLRGRPRIDGVAEDIAAANARQEEFRRAGQSSLTEARGPTSPSARG
jgi:uncharacterized protein YndB with AHSA1/START domain